MNRVLDRCLVPSAFRDELAELSNKGDAKQSHFNLEESPSRKGFFHFHKPKAIANDEDNVRNTWPKRLT
jgi:hypothetical protein